MGSGLLVVLVLWVIFSMGAMLVVACRKIGHLEKQLDDAVSAWHRMMKENVILRSDKPEDLHVDEEGQIQRNPQGTGYEVRSPLSAGGECGSSMSHPGSSGMLRS